MATEVMQMRFLFRPTGTPEWIPTLKFDINKACEQIVKDVPFYYNAIHDLESAWWVGIWMLFFYKPKGHTETSQKSSKRQHETNLAFSGKLNSCSCRFLYLEHRGSFLDVTTPWISNECWPAVNVIEYVRVLLKNIYRNLEKTFPNGLGKLSERAQAHTNGHHDAFPGGPGEDIYKPIQDAFLAAKEEYERHKIEIVYIPAGE
jgi:hypothetical protein